VNDGEQRSPLRNRLYAVLVLAGLALISISAIAAADGSTDPNYTVYGGCGLGGATRPSHLCRKGDELGAFFRSNTADAVYEVCVRFPTGKRLCAPGQLASQGTLYVNKITSNIEGSTFITWAVNSQEVGSWHFGLYPKPVVPRFGINPLIVSRTHRLFGILLRNVPSGLRVRAWRQCHGNCPLPLRLISSRGGNRRYRIAGSPAGSTFSLGEKFYVQVDAPGRRDHGTRVWGRLYRGKLVRDRSGGPKDTAIHSVGTLLCTPPGKTYRAARGCNQVPG